jgi:peptidyl-prolyl cis-trans isomerase SurA
MSLTILHRTWIAAVFSLFVLQGLILSVPVSGATRAVLAVVNDEPITSFDVEQRIKLTAVLGSGKKLTRKQAVETLINDVLKRRETKRLKATLTEDQVDAAVERLAKGSGTTVDGLTAKLKSVGISLKALRAQLLTNLSFNRVLIARYKIKPEVNDADVDKKLAALKQDPRLQPVAVYEIREIVLPIDLNDPFADQLIQARAVEARQIQQKYTDCASIKEAISGIFNVDVSRQVQVPADKLPKKLRDALNQTGTKALIGPMRAKEGIQLIAYCGNRTITPEAPSREQVQRLLVEQLYDVYEEKYLRELRRTALIDYKDPSLRQDQTQ